MELEHLSKKIEWLDEEHRKDKNTLIALEEHLNALDENVKAALTQIKDIGSEVTRLAALLTRMNQLDESMLKHKRDTKKSLEDLDNEIKKREEEAGKVRMIEMRSVEERLSELRKEVSTIAEIKHGLQNRIDEEVRMMRLIEEITSQIEALQRNEEEFTRIYKLLEDGRRQDSKRLTDLLGEVNALRKRADDFRGQMELASTNIRKLETRMNEWEAIDTERRKDQMKFMEQQSINQAERERVWKEWQTRFELVEKHAQDIENYIQSLDATHRTVKQSQKIVEDLSQKIERRISEMTEIQRLAEERFRQEWVIFKADDQKRWTNYTLTQEEQHGEVLRQFERLSDRVTKLEDNSEEMRDIIQLMTEQSEKQLQSLLALVHDWVSVFERSLGKPR